MKPVFLISIRKVQRTFTQLGARMPVPWKEVKGKMEEERSSETAETMLQSLYARAKESEKEHPKIRDPKAVETVNRIGHDFTDVEKDAVMSAGVIARTIVLDRMVSAFIQKHPFCTVINLACGMDTRFYRVDNGKIRWYNVDLPVAMALRAEYIQEDKRVENITASAMEEGWTSYIQKTKEPILVIMEGFSMYLKEKDIRQILAIIDHHFSKVTVFMEILNPLFIGRKADGSDEQCGVKYTWGARSGKELTDLCPAFHWLKDVSLGEGMKEVSPVYKVLGRIDPFRNLASQIAVIRK